MVEIRRRRSVPTIIHRRRSVAKPTPSFEIYGNHWDKIEGGRDKCFVCDKKFRSHHEQRYIGRHKYTGAELHRHHYCETNSHNWIKKFGGYVSLNIKSVPKKEKPAPEHKTLRRRIIK